MAGNLRNVSATDSFEGDRRGDSNSPDYTDDLNSVRREIYQRVNPLDMDESLDMSQSTQSKGRNQYHTKSRSLHHNAGRHVTLPISSMAFSRNNDNQVQ